MNSRIYLSHVAHNRFYPTKHEFEYPVTSFLFDLDELPLLNNFLFGYNRHALLSLWDKDYLSLAPGGIKERLISFILNNSELDVNSIRQILLLTSPRILNYAFNPVSFYFCYTADQKILAMVAEVNNTFGERHLYLLTEKQRVETKGGLDYNYTTQKNFYVSPFFDVKGEYVFNFKDIHKQLDIKVTLAKDDKTVFFARLYCDKQPLPWTSKYILRGILQYPSYAFLNMPRITYEASRLYFSKKLPLVKRPEPAGLHTVKRRSGSYAKLFMISTIERFLSKLSKGRLEITYPSGEVVIFGETDISPTTTQAKIKIHHSEFFSKVFFRGDVGFGESYVDGDWECDSLTKVLEIFALNLSAADDRSLMMTWFARLKNLITHALRFNNRKHAKDNIHAHYDLSNKLFSTFLDRKMLYSAAIFADPTESLEQAQQRKIDIILKKLSLCSTDHLLEIGCGWGSLMIEAVKQYGCKVTGITLSKEQLEFAQARVKAENLESQIKILLCDYRDLEATTKTKYDKIVSVEMLEAVGHAYFGEFFRVCESLLKQDGLMLLQTITIPDQRYEMYRYGCDWIQRYIFPGGMLPSLEVLTSAITKHSSFVVEHLDNIGIHYATTLRHWRERFNQQLPYLESLGFDQRFERMWNYYLCYCEAGFSTRSLNTLQLLLTRAQNSSLASPY
jgi:cyclopropane-fatty-acyl-phospholipid synthase